MLFGVRQNEARYRTVSSGRSVLSENRQEEGEV
ncbi:hypothetical protein GMJAKD_09745 [Candidatus Electrothrix aarhusensis]|jgi:hypothetical protein